MVPVATGETQFEWQRSRREAFQRLASLDLRGASQTQRHGDCYEADHEPSVHHRLEFKRSNFSLHFKFTCVFHCARIVRDER